MKVTLDNIKFYPPPSLPARPTKSPNHHPISSLHHTAKSSNLTPSTLCKLPLPFTQPTLPHPLPPRPPAIIPSSHHSTSETLYCHSNTSHSSDPHSKYENDFDRALDDFFSGEDGKNDRGAESPIRVQDHGNQDLGPIISPDLEGLSQMTASLPSPSFTNQNLLKLPADAKPTQSITGDKSQLRDEVNITSVTSPGRSPAFCTSAPPTSASSEMDTDSTGVTAQDSVQNSSVTNRQHSETPNTNGGLSHSPKSGGSSVTSESVDLRGGTGDSKRPSSSQLEESSKRKRSPSACPSYPPAPLVVVSVPSRPLSLRRKSTRSSSDHFRYTVGTAGDSCESDSAPSDDENDADYSNYSKIKTAFKSLRPAKRRRRVPDKALSASREPRQSFSEASSFKQPESPLKDLDVESKPIPIQGFLRLRYSGREVIYCVEFSQTDLLSSVAASQVEPTKPYQQTVRPTAKIPYTPEEEAYIKELKAENLGWGKIETLFAQQFPYRKASCLAAHYYTKLRPSSKSGGKGRAKPKLKKSPKRGKNRRAKNHA